MSETLTVTEALNLAATLSQPGVGGTLTYPFSQSTGGSMATGFNANDKANQFFAGQFTLAASASSDFNLYTMGGVNDAMGNAYTMAKLKKLVILMLGNLGCSYLSAVAPSGTCVSAVAVHAGSAGSGYSVSDVLTVAGGTGTGATATVSSVDGSGAITGITLTTSGIYSVNPTLSANAATGGGGSLATLDLTMVAATGSGFVVNDVLTIAGGTGTSATVKVATVSIGTHAATSFTVLTPGSYSVAPTATANAAYSTVLSAVPHSGSAGSSYVMGDVVTVAGGTGTAATLTVASVSTGALATLTVLNPGAYTVNPTISGNAVTGGTGSSGEVDLTMSASGASATINLTLTVAVAGSQTYVESDTLTVGAKGTTAGWTAVLTPNTASLVLKSGTLANPECLRIGEGGAAGYTVGSSSTNNILKLANTGANPITYLLVAVGTTS